MRHPAAFVLAATCLLAACGKPKAAAKGFIVPGKEMPTTTLSQPPEVAMEREGDFRDLEFRVEEKHPAGQNPKIHFLRLTGTDHGKPLAFGMAWGAMGQWREIKENALPYPIYEDFVTFNRTTTGSDAFIQALASVYGVNAKDLKLAPQVPAGAISLTGDPRHLEKGPCRVKIFFRKGADEDYAELFVNLDLPHSRLELKEKDTSYREKIVECLKG